MYQLQSFESLSVVARRSFWSEEQFSLSLGKTRQGCLWAPTPGPAAAVNAARFIATFVDMNWVLMTPCHPFLLVCVTILVNFIMVKK